MANARRVLFPYEKWRTQRVLIPTGNPQVFTTPEKFVHIVPGSSIAVYFNGQRLEQGIGCDFTVSESVPTAGYDTVSLLFTPVMGDKVFADYFIY